MRDPQFVASYAFKRITQIYDLVSPSEFARTYGQISGLTMCSNARLRGLHRAVKYAIDKGVPGDIVECGTARGGSAALMGLNLLKLGASERTLWLFDTFEGIPPPTADDPDFEIAQFHTGAYRGSIDDVRASFEELEILDLTRFVKGLLQGTLPSSDVGNIAVLHIDCDWYLSVRACLDHLFDRVVEGGVIQFDDYGFWKGTQKAVDEFFEERSIEPQLKRLDYSGRQYVKMDDGPGSP